MSHLDPVLAWILASVVINALGKLLFSLVSLARVVRYPIVENRSTEQAAKASKHFLESGIEASNVDSAAKPVAVGTKHNGNRLYYVAFRRALGVGSVA
ncbi:hypothetical protein CROQUDRAFT_95797 [Cronartium quercuum f. sp. fusiforme G11]|uniref:Uncharacterized protein n=1 Tax=Cronartium quercuum f. sp. fusiforme G11 TaxID=708437 RepID=A0A9P6T954_9BASI|nr:hypothetical protein CROQUDRAFT_95797 [Cronartium quercuum f. sp. fusiforme G11]